MTSTIFISSPLRKSAPSLVDNPAANDVLCAIIAGEEKHLTPLVEYFNRSLRILESSLKFAQDIIAILEELGGITVRAKNFIQEPNGDTRYATQIEEQRARFETALKKLDIQASQSTCEDINMMMGDNLTTVFDIEQQHKMVTPGMIMTSSGLGFRKPDFTTLGKIQNSRIDVMNAIDIAVSLRNLIQGDIYTIMDRRDFSVLAIESAQLGCQKVKTLKAHSEQPAYLKIRDKALPFELADQAQTQIFENFARKSGTEE